MDNLTQEQIKEQIEDMRRQELELEKRLLMTRGAMQGFEHLLSLFNPELGDALPESEADDGADS